MFMIPRGEFAPPRGRPVKYPIGILNVGESMFFAGITRRQIAGSVRCHRPKLFKFRTVIEGGVQGVRVTRVEKMEPDHPKGGRPPKFPLRKMNVGESMFCPGETAKTMWDRYRRLQNKRFEAKTVMVRGQIAARVWRTE